MSLTENDPLRFLKPRKKQFHLTPTKNKSKITDNSQLNILRQSSATQYNSNISQKPLAKNHNVAQQTDLGFLLKAKQQQASHRYGQVQNKFNTSNPKAQYNPLKYFSQAVQDFLTNKTIEPHNKTVTINQRPTNYLKFPNPDQSYQDESIEIQAQRNDKRNQLDQHQTTQHLYSKESQPTLKITQKPQPQPIVLQKQQSKPQSRAQKRNSTKQVDKKPQQKNQEMSQTEEQGYQDENQGQVVLKRCEICSRSFNPNSYEKHVRVCEKVFFKKRKEFSSQKQRSLSKKKK